MINPIDIVISADQLKYLINTAAVNQADVSSLIDLEKVRPLTPEDRKELLKAELITSNDELSEDIKGVTQVVLNAKACSWVSYGSSTMMFDCTIYMDGKDTVALLSTEDGIRLTAPAPIEVIIEMFRQNTGDNIFSALELETTLSRNASFVLAAIIDLRRKQVLQSIINSTAAAPIPVSPDEITAWLNKEKLDAQWLSARLSDYLERSTPLPPEGISQGVIELAKAELIYETSGTYKLTEECDLLANRFLLLDNSITIRAARTETNRSTSVLHFEVIKSGLSDLLFCEQQDTDHLKLNTLSPAAFLAVLKDLLENPAAIPASPPAIPGKP